MKGWIYIMSNSAFADGLIKIGRSSNDPIKRKEQLETTGVPEAFLIEYQALVIDHEASEKRIHRLLDYCRPNKKAEFFTCAIPEAILAIQSNCQILYEEIRYKSPEEIDKLRRQKERQKFEAEAKQKKSDEEVLNQKKSQQKQDSDLNGRDTGEVSVSSIIARTLIFLRDYVLAVLFFFGGLHLLNHVLERL